MATLLLRLAGALQAWGSTSRFDERDTQLEPTKSGVLGLICAALGRDRAQPVEDLAALRMAVRVDREGLLMRDYQTVIGEMLTASGKVDRSGAVVSPRYYLSDAVFLVGLEGERALLDEIQKALRQPHWPLALGRKSMPPSLPVWLPDGMRDESLREALQRYPRIVKSKKAATDTQPPLRMMIEHASEGSIRLDQPIAPFAERRFGPRFVKQEELINVPDEVIA
jgi:CRISPR system Cascade subunit CasD